ncbi:MAG TPA: peptidylprolyl isomerase, partial [Pyrinomonadaceae bacterium]|nr:peptidylprolyl isomerase [Pyrinomonadaceae bacterium]
SNPLLSVCLLLLLSPGAFSQKRGQILHNPTSGDPVPKLLLLRIVHAEDERRWDDELRSLFRARNANVRSRAALAAGRIGNEAAVADLAELLRHDDEWNVRAMAAFSLGEIESPLGADALLEALVEDVPPVRPRALEALGKIVAALPMEQEARGKELGAALLERLNHIAHRRAQADQLTMLLGITAVLRAKPANAGPLLAEFLSLPDARIRADAANALTRLKLKDGNDRLRKLLISDPDPIVRANAARVLGATEDRPAFADLLDRALNDKDLRVRVSSIRALATLKDPRAAEALIRRGTVLTENDFTRRGSAAGEALEVATALGRILQASENIKALDWLRSTRARFGSAAPEIEIALARISPAVFLDELGSGAAGKKNVQTTILVNWRAASALAQGLGEIAATPDSNKDKKRLTSRTEELLRFMLDYRNSGLTINTLVAVHSEYAVPDVLRAFAAFKPNDLAKVLRNHLKESDVVTRGSAADLLGELTPDEENQRALIAALPLALADKQLNDAALSILDALAKQKNTKANEAIKTALDSNDHLVRRRAVALLKTNGIGDFSSRIGTVKTTYTTADYERAVGRIGKQVRAVVTTTKGSFTIEFRPEDAPLTVDNFIQLSRRNYFNGFTVHRVVPNFVIQDGDPRGDGNGGPGYQIRCEINEAPYERGAVGMALSGKDTGGSQWFVTHSPQPHLDGGYTVFGNVISGMDVVDNIARGDVIQSIAITERKMPAKRR